MKLGAEHAAGADLLVVLVVMGGQLKIRFQLGAGRLAGLAIDKALKTPAIALDHRHAQVVFFWVMVVDGGVLHAQLAGNMLVAEGVEATGEQQILGHVENALFGVLPVVVRLGQCGSGHAANLLIDR